MTNLLGRQLTLIAMVIVMTMRSSLVQVSGNRIYYQPGETQPVTVEEAIGADFNITCYMNPKAFPGKNSSSLYFVNGRTDDILPPENIIITNSSTIVYMVQNASEQQREYRCKCGSSAIMDTKVFVGTPPRPAMNFTCRSYDFDYMICNFTKPHNPILTTYNVSYYNDMPSYKLHPDCNYDDRALVVCNTSLKTRYMETYHFIIESRNALVAPNDPPLTQNFVVNTLEIMIPSMPGENIRVDSVTVDMIRLTFEMPKWEKYRKGLQWEVLVKPENASVLVYEPPVREHSELRLRLNNLPYAFWRYDLMLRVRVKHPNAVWSDQLVFPFRTAARRPVRAPQMQPGSFYIDSMETHVTIYWEELQPFEYNGDNFSYAIRSVRRDGNLIDLKPIQMEMNLAVFQWHKYSQYEFEICSRNHMGNSTKSSHLTVYPFNSRMFPKNYMPKDINNVYHANNRSYTLTWSKPRQTVGLLNYTVFWCYPKRALPNECRESMHFQQVPVSQLNFTTEKQNALEEHTLNLAVSANYESFNTGLHWTDCTMDVNGDLVKMDSELMDLMPGTTSIKIHWNVERVCTSILEGFNLTYCEVADNVASDNATCLESPHKIFKSKYEKRYNITGLKPFTMYKFSMYMFSRTKNGKPSDPQLIRTLEGAPSPPRQLKVFDITNTTAKLKWLEPRQPNGRIRKYIIMLNNDKIEVNATTLEYHLTGLESFMSYKAYVLAQTVDTSETSNDVHFTTSIGYPSPPGQAPRSNNASVVQWSKPAKPHGRVEFYEVAVTQKRKEEVIRQRISIIMDGETSCSFPKIPPCLGTEYQTTVEVRAVNAALLTHETKDDIEDLYSQSDDNYYNYNNYDNDDLVCDGDGRHTKENNPELRRYLDASKYRLYKSAWQTSTIYSCSTSRMSKITTVALVVVAMSLGVMAALYMARKKYNKMANINCTLPAGLETYFTKDGSGFPGDFVSSPQKSIESATRAAEDQWISAARMHEFNFRNEHHHLLASLGNDSGYLGGNGCIGSDNINGRNLSSSLETTNVTDESAEPLDEDEEEAFEKQNYKTQQHNNCFASNASSSVDSLVESTEESDTPNSDAEQDALSIFPKGNGYVKQSMLQPWQNFQEENQSQPNNSSYITVQSLKTAPATAVSPPSAGYVLQQDLQNFFKNSISQQKNALPPAALSKNVTQTNSGVTGYTTLDELPKFSTKPIPIHYEALSQPPDNNQPLENINNLCDGTVTTAVHDINSKTNNAGGKVGADNNSSGCISGYVTQQDLNIFAQHQQH